MPSSDLCGARARLFCALSGGAADDALAGRHYDARLIKLKLIALVDYAENGGGLVIYCPLLHSSSIMEQVKSRFLRRLKSYLTRSLL